MQAHVFALRVYYEDTDLAGIVYYANYLKFIERARTEWVRSHGVDQAALKADHGIVFSVRHIEADYIAPARFDDTLEVITKPKTSTGARLVLLQDVCKDGKVLFQSSVTLVALAHTGWPVRLPAEIRLISPKIG
jgi:acyl-CoA thioester hydrolase